MASTTYTPASNTRVRSKSTTTGYFTPKPDPFLVVQPENAWCCPLSPSSTPPPPRDTVTDSDSSTSHLEASSFRIRFSPGSQSPVMDFTPANGHQSPVEHSFPSSFTKFNSALTAGLLNPMSPPPPPIDKTRSSPTLFEMMASEPDAHQRTPTQIQNGNVSSLAASRTTAHLVVSAEDKKALAMQRITDLLTSWSPGNQFNDPDSSDVRLTLSSKDGISVCLNVHRQILVAHSRFFAMKLSDRWANQQRPYIVEISDCDNVEVYIGTLRLMYSRDLKKKLMREDVPRVLGILKVSAAIGFDAGVLSCLEYLEAAPWDENEEEKIASLISELRLENVGSMEVLKRVSTESGSRNSEDNEEVLLKLLQAVLEGKDEKARREMKGLVSKMLRENCSGNELRKESLYVACDGCLQMLKQPFLDAASSDLESFGKISRQADNLHWLLDILIDRQSAEDFLSTWASLSDLAEAHSRVPAVHRYEVSGVTARLFVGIGKGQILAPKEVRYLLLQTWLVPFYDDFGWMKRASKGLDRYLIEEGLSNTILTLPLAWQQEFFLAWFDRFLNSGEDCPNIQRGFEVWWRRAFWRRKKEQEEPRQLRIMPAATENS